MKITVTTKSIIIDAPYSAAFVDAARNLGGVFKSGTGWVFDIRNEAMVREACYRYYGDDGIRKNLCDVRITLPQGMFRGQRGIEFFGKPVARAFGRDGGAKMEPGIVVEAGGFDSGGSMKNWGTTAQDGTVIIVRDVSRTLVEEHVNDEKIVVEILPATAPVDKNELRAERERLLARIAEIDALLEA